MLGFAFKGRDVTKRRMHDGYMWENPKFAQLEMIQRLLFCGLIDVVDDQGRMIADAPFVRSRVFPFDDISTDDMQKHLTALARNESILFYTVDDQLILQIANWWKYQSPQWAQPSKLPTPPDWTDRIRHRVGGQVFTYNWSKRTGELLPDTCSPFGQPLAPPSPNALPKPLPKAVSKAEGEGYGYGKDQGEGDGQEQKLVPRPSSRPLKMQEDNRPLAVRIYAEEVRYTPAPGSITWDRLTKHFPNDSFDHVLWRRIVGDWLGHGWSKKNVDGMVECFRRGTVERESGQALFAESLAQQDRQRQIDQYKQQKERDAIRFGGGDP